MKLEFSVHNFEESSNIKFHENLSTGSRVFPYGLTAERTDGHETNSRFSQSYESA